MKPPPATSTGQPDWVASGHFIAIDGNLDAVPQYRGEHLWTWAAVFAARPGARPPVLDRESLIRVAGIACLHCALEYTRRIDGKFCPGGATMMARNEW